MTTAVIMAGGRSARMRATTGPTHKALVPVLGVPMLERNLGALLSEGFRHLAVALSAHEPEVDRYVRDRGRALASARNARLEILTEPSPLGTIGAVAALDGADGSVLVVNVDNLTALSLAKLVAFHEAAAAAMTVASHTEMVRVPCGELQLADGIITAYLEKPTKRIAASSGTYVLSPRTVAMMAMRQRWDAPDLVTALIARDEKVCAYPHDAPWIDVNDSAALTAAEQLITEHSDAFEHWKDAPAHEVVAVLVCSPSRVLLVQRPPRAPRYPGLWDVPGAPLPRDAATPPDAADQILARLVPGIPPAPTFLTSFDDLDVATGCLIRHHAFVARATDAPPAPPLDGEARWVARARLDRLGPMSSPLVRSLACAERRR